jgi:hypothetical protein
MPALLKHLKYMQNKLIILVKDVMSIRTKPIQQTGLPLEEQVQLLETQNREMKIVYFFWNH